MSPYSIEHPIILTSSNPSIEIKHNDIEQPNPLVSNTPQKEKQASRKQTILRPKSIKRNKEKVANNDFRGKYYSTLGITRHSSNHPPKAIKPALKQRHDSILSKCTNALDNRTSSVKFNKNVTIVPVPNRSLYPPDIKSKLWLSPIESKKNLLRNTFEFAFEGGDWRTAVEECNMIHCAVTGQKIHPFHACTAHNYGMTKGNFLLYSKMAAEYSPF